MNCPCNIEIHAWAFPGCGFFCLYVILFMPMYHQLLFKMWTCPAAKGLYHFLGYKLMNIFPVHNTYTDKSWPVDHAVIGMRWALLNIFFPPHVMLHKLNKTVCYKLVSEITVMFYAHSEYVSFLILVRNFSIFAD